MQTLAKNNSGFTIIELLMAMTTGIIVLAGIYAAFDSQQKIHTKEQQVTDAVQNVRGAAHFMVREIRLAGMDVTGTAGAGFLIAGPHSIQFTLDRDDGGGGDPDGDVADADEDITYSFSAAVDTNANGIADPGATSLTLTRTAFDAGLGAFTDDRLAEDIYAVGFAYAFDSDGDGEVDFEDSDGDSELDAGEEIWAYDLRCGRKPGYGQLHRSRFSIRRKFRRNKGCAGLDPGADKTPAQGSFRAQKFYRR